MTGESVGDKASAHHTAVVQRQNIARIFSLANQVNPFHLQVVTAVPDFIRRDKKQSGLGEHV